MYDALLHFLHPFPELSIKTYKLRKTHSKGSYYITTKINILTERMPSIAKVYLGIMLQYRYLAVYITFHHTMDIYYMQMLH